MIQTPVLHSHVQVQQIKWLIKLNIPIPFKFFQALPEGIAVDIKFFSRFLFITPTVKKNFKCFQVRPLLSEIICFNSLQFLYILVRLNDLMRRIIQPLDKPEVFKTPYAGFIWPQSLPYLQSIHGLFVCLPEH